MELKTIDDIEKKYPGISDKKGWLDLHIKRGQSEISDEDFRLELLNFGMENSDAESYIQLLQNLNKSFEDMTEDYKILEMMDIGFKYENYYDKEPDVLNYLNQSKEEAARDLLLKQFDMLPQEIDDVITHLKFRIKMEGTE
jgi:hypothetical protein